MCLACEEMDLYFAYLEQREAAKRAAAGGTDNGAEGSDASLRTAPAASSEVPPADEDVAAA